MSVRIPFISPLALCVLAVAFSTAPAAAVAADAGPSATAAAKRHHVSKKSKAAQRRARIDRKLSVCLTASPAQLRSLRKKGQCSTRQIAELRKLQKAAKKRPTRPGSGNSGNGSGNGSGSDSGSPRTGTPRTGQPRAEEPAEEPRTEQPAEQPRTEQPAEEPRTEQPGTSNPDPGTSNPDPGTSNPDPGTSNPGPGTSNPDPGTGTPGGAKGYNGFGPGNWPGGDWRPFAPSSPWNQPVGNAAVHPNSDAYVKKVLGWNKIGSLVAGTADSTKDYNHPTYYAQPSDPIYTLNALSSRNELQGMRIRVPSEARAAGGSDGHMTIVQPDGWTYDLWQVRSKPAGGGTLTYSIGGRSRIDGNGTDGRATAANFPNLAGIIRAQELAAGRINHALFLVIRCTTGTTHFGYGAKPAPSSSQGAWVYPASHGGARCDDPNVPPMGTRFQLAMSESQINALSLPNWKKTILRAVATYGAYVGDTGGPGFAFQFESGATYTSFGYKDPMVTLAQSAGLRPGTGDWANTYAFDMWNGVDWTRYLRVVTPPSPGATAASAPRTAKATPTKLRRVR